MRMVYVWIDWCECPDGKSWLFGPRSYARRATSWIIVAISAALLVFERDFDRLGNGAGLTTRSAVRRLAD